MTPEEALQPVAPDSKPGLTSRFPVVGGSVGVVPPPSSE